MNGRRPALRERRTVPDLPRSGHSHRQPYRPPRLRRHGRLRELTGAAEGTVNDGAGGFFAFSGAAG
jgi:hypothetical protein